MKLVYCPNCHDIFNLRLEMKYCSCKRAYGKYLEDKINAEISNEAIPIGFHNKSFIAALNHQPVEGMGERFEAFIIPIVCPTIKVTL